MSIKQAKFSLVNDATAQEVDKDLKRSFDDFLDNVEPDRLEQFEEVIPVPRKSVNQMYYGQLLQMQRWVGEKKLQDLQQRAFNVNLEPWESSVAIEREDAGAPGISQVIAKRLGQAANKFREQRRIEALQSGSVALNGFGNVPFFYDTHVLDPAGTQSNILSGTNVANDPTGSLEAAVTRLESFKNENGEPFGARATHWFVPTQLFGVASAAVQPTLPQGGANPWAGTVEVVKVPRLNSEPTTSYMYAGDMGIPLFVYYEREAPQVKFLGEGSDHEFFYRQWVWSCEAFATTTLSFWPCCLKITA